MIAEQSLPINRKILKWARTQAHLTPEKAVEKAKIHALTRGISLSSVERLKQWEEGVDTPSFAQLESLAKAYRRPILTFFLAEPPAKHSIVQDFRTIGDTQADTDTPEFNAFVRQVETLQIDLHDILESAGNKPLDFIGSQKSQDSPELLAETIRKTLDYSLDDQIKAQNGEIVFSDIRAKAHDKGIFILLWGNLGSYHTDFDPEVFRGLAISDALAPLIVVNPNDTKAARVFTLVHELCHLWLGESGISNWTSISSKKKARRNEQLCNQVAAEFLVPANRLLNYWTRPANKAETEEWVKRSSQRFRVSQIVIARRLLDLEIISDDHYWDFYNRFMQAFLESEERQRSKGEFRIPRRITVRSKLGDRLRRPLRGYLM